MSTMFDIAQEIPRIEMRIKKLGRNVPDFIRAAGVHPATWRRWRAGSHAPNLTTWLKVQQSIAELGGEGRNISRGK